MTILSIKLDRRIFLAGTMGSAISLSACSEAQAQVVIVRDTGCGCCLEWMERIKVLGMKQSQSESDDRSDLWQRFGMPPELASCHSAIIGDYLFEGHVPPGDILRVLREKPDQVRGLAVPGMPVGSPGMEQGEMKQTHDVIAFGPPGKRIFSHQN